jgi:hypothetical protein
MTWIRSRIFALGFESSWLCFPNIRDEETRDSKKPRLVMKIGVFDSRESLTWR